MFLSQSLAGDGNVFPYETHEKTLENGLTIYVIPMDTPNVAQVRTWMTVGSRDEMDPGRTGFAHFFEHLMFYGTPSLNRQEREKVIQNMGAEENAWTWFDDTVYHATLAANHVEKYIQIEGDRFQNLQLTEDMVRKEAGAVYGEYRKGQASPVNRVYETLYATAFQTHTYRHDTIGFEEDIAQELQARARDFLDAESLRLAEERRALGVEDELAAIDGLNAAMLVTLGEREIKTLEDFADLAGDELTDLEEGYLREYGFDLDTANALIMSARIAAGWFTAEELAEAEAATVAEVADAQAEAAPV